VTSIISYLQSLSFKLANFIFGQTVIFVVILGLYLVITGLIFLTNPNKARAKLATSGFGIVKLNALLVCFFLWGVLSKIAQGLSGNIQILVFWGGLIGLVMLFLRVCTIAKNKLTVLAGQLPLKALKWFAWGQVIVGGLMVYFQRRLW